MATVNNQRLQMIRSLIAHSVSTAMAESQRLWLNEVFENGFIGYRNMSNRQLRTEMQQRGLDPFTYDDSADDDFDADSDCGFADQESSLYARQRQAHSSFKSPQED